jgi:hypothetical protein
MPLRWPMFRRQFTAGLSLLLIPLAACSSNPKGQDNHSLPSAVPSTFNPCTDMPGKVLTSQGLNPKPDHELPDSLSGDQKYKGCDYRTQSTNTSGSGSDVMVKVTNMDLDYFRKSYQPQRTLTIGKRTAATVGSDNNTECTLFMTINGGGVWFSTAMHDRDACQVLVDLATVIEPTLPNGA